MVAEKLEKSKFLLYIVSLIKQNIFVFNQHEFLWNHIFILPFKVYIYIYIYIYIAQINFKLVFGSSQKYERLA